MGVNDLIVTPIYIILFSIIAVLIRPHVTNNETRKYFLTALWVRFIGAIGLGMVYQFYYEAGDTFNYFNQSKPVFDAFFEKPLIALKMIFASNDVITPEFYPYASRIYWYTSDEEFFIIRIIALLSILTGGTYSAISLFFASFSFLGIWLIFTTFQKYLPSRTDLLALCVLFLPTVVFWGSGIMKDSIAIGAFGISFYASHALIEGKRITINKIMLLIFSWWVLYNIKIYILMCYLPTFILWIYFKFGKQLKYTIIKWLIIPVMLFGLVFLGFLILNQLSQSSARYQLDSLAERVYITSYDIRYFTGKDAGSGYSLGRQDGTWQTLLKMTPAAINVSLFRPYLWEVRNPLMLISALEALAILVFTFLLLPTLFKSIFRFSPMMKASLVFSLVFAFAVGVSSYNFGTLSRYKIPLLPLYLSTMLMTSESSIKTKSA